ncbi:mRNA-decapping enzyme 1B [Frankliniella fusca]|uniref:mRNA-decapping enzyme 1B n=1 Tax=Frankliniella fusca TaxID=407009 RepID=A0AAE1GZF7_9NEOP|nr:mRNA-decapping enzyme 1B [Frankliniella fusca]
MADSNAASNQINLAAVKRVDPYARDILEKASQVALYSFNGEKNEWKKTEVEGALFVYSRTGEPFHNILIMNRLSTQNLMEPVVQGLDIQRQEPFLLYRNSKCDINGIWFYDKDECVRIAGVLDRLVREAPLTNCPPPVLKPVPVSAPLHNNNNNNNGTDIFSMLSKAQEDYFSKTVLSPNHVPDSQPAETPQTVLDFFAKASTSSSKPSVTQSPALFIAQHAAQRVQAPEAHDPNLKPILQRLKSNPVHSVEHIEKQQRSVTPQQIDVQPTEPKSAQKDQKKSGFKLKPVKENGRNKGSGPSANPVNNQVQAVTNGISFLRISPTTVAGSPQQGVLASPRTPGTTGPILDSRPDVTPKPALMPPVMFTSSPAHEASLQTPPHSHPAHVILGNQGSRSPPLKPEPLTKNQLLQAFHYLLKNDPDFVNTLHEAYVKSFAEIVP